MLRNLVKKRTTSDQKDKPVITGCPTLKVAIGDDKWQNQTNKKTQESHDSWDSWLSHHDLIGRPPVWETAALLSCYTITDDVGLLLGRFRMIRRFTVQIVRMTQEETIMTFDKILIWVMAIGILAGGLDRILGNKFGLGKKFEDGFQAMGPLALGMVGIVTLAPVIAKTLGPVIIPVFRFFGSDPSMFAAILANDMGGYPLAMTLAQNEQAGLLAGLVIASMLGCTVVFSIPVGLGLIEHKDRPFFAKGLLAGLTTIPYGGIVGGLVAGFDIRMVLVNLVPVLLFSLLILLGLFYFPTQIIKGALIFGKFIVAVATVGLASSAFEMLTGIAIIPGMAPITDGMVIVGQIAIVLLGSFPILTLVIKVLEKPLTAAGKKLGMNTTGAAGIVISLANSIPVFKMFKDMDDKSKIMNTAWLVPASCVFGDHLGFTLAVSPDMIASVVIAKLAAGVLALFVAMWVCRALPSSAITSTQS